MASRPQEAKVFGHPAGLFTLFFAEMWERFSYYGMRALLVFYMIKGFLGYTDDQAYGVYGAYTALVYATPFIGGMLADKLLGARRAVIIGGTLMALGHLLMTVENKQAFFVALGLLIVGNGFFKPNISTIVGTLYEATSPKRDAGFTIFYMGINLGAAMSPLLCGYVGEKFGWHYGFGLATIGMLIGLAVFIAPTLVTQAMILGGAIASGVALIYFQNSPYTLAINIFVASALIIAALVATVALQRGGLPDDSGLAPDPEALRRPFLGPLNPDMTVLLGVLVVVPVLALLVQNSEIAGYMLYIFGGGALAWLLYGAVTCEKIERERLFVVLILMFFSMLFWAFFEQAGSSVNNFTDRNVDRVSNARLVTKAEVGQTLEIEPNEGQLGYRNGDKMFTMTDLDNFRKEKEKKIEELSKNYKAGGMSKEEYERGCSTAAKANWTVSEQNVGMGQGGNEMPASTFQAANAIFIVVLGLIFSAMWGFLGKRGLEPSTPVKFSLGLMQLGLGFLALWFGSEHGDSRGMVWVGWLILAYLLQTTGELCLSPVGLSMVTKLSPARMTSTVMGAWFLATAFSNFLAGKIAKLTGVQGEEGKVQVIPPPLETIHVYGGVFKIIAFTAIASGVICLVISPILKKWMHTDVTLDETNPDSVSGVPEEEYGFTPPTTHPE